MCVCLCVISRSTHKKLIIMDTAGEGNVEVGDQETALLRYNLHIIHDTHSKSTIPWLLVYLQNCATISTVNFKIFSSAPKKPSGQLVT